MPGEAKAYEATLGAVVTSTAGDATLTVADTQDGSGHLVNGTHKFAAPLMLKATNAAKPTATFAPLSGLANPLTLIHYDTYVANDAVTISVQQPIGAQETLRAGGYGKAVTFSLSTTIP